MDRLIGAGRDEGLQLAVDVQLAKVSLGAAKLTGDTKATVQL